MSLFMFRNILPFDDLFRITNIYVRTYLVKEVTELKKSEFVETSWVT